MFLLPLPKNQPSLLSDTIDLDDASHTDECEEPLKGGSGHMSGIDAGSDTESGSEDDAKNEDFADFVDFEDDSISDPPVESSYGHQPEGYIGDVSFKAILYLLCYVLLL